MNTNKKDPPLAEETARSEPRLEAGHTHITQIQIQIQIHKYKVTRQNHIQQIMSYISWLEVEDS